MMKIIAEAKIDTGVILLNQEHVDFVYKKRFDTDGLIDEIFAFLCVKYKKKEIFTHEVNSYELSTWNRFQDKRNQMETIYKALKEGMTVTVTRKEYYFFFEEKLKLTF